MKPSIRNAAPLPLFLRRKLPPDWSISGAHYTRTTWRHKDGFMELSTKLDISYKDSNMEPSITSLPAQWINLSPISSKTIASNALRPKICLTWDPGNATAVLPMPIWTQKLWSVMNVHLITFITSMLSNVKDARSAYTYLIKQINVKNARKMSTSISNSMTAWNAPRNTITARRTRSASPAT